MRKNHQDLRYHVLDRWLARGAVLLIVALQIGFVNDLSIRPTWLAPSIELALLIPLSVGTIWTQRAVRTAETMEEWRLVRTPPGVSGNLSATARFAFRSLLPTERSQ